MCDFTFRILFVVIQNDSFFIDSARFIFVILSHDIEQQKTRSKSTQSDDYLQHLRKKKKRTPPDHRSSLNEYIPQRSTPSIVPYSIVPLYNQRQRS
jgi:hypothetical protein